MNPTISVVVVGDKSKFPLLDDLMRTLHSLPSVDAQLVSDDLKIFSSEKTEKTFDCDVVFNWGPINDVVRELHKHRTKRLRWICNRFAGVDNLMNADLISSDVVVTNGRGCFSDSLAEFVIFGALYFSKNYLRLAAQQREHLWEKFNLSELSRQTIAIVGYGDIGVAIAKRAKAFNMRILGLRRNVSVKKDGDELLSEIFPTEKLHEMIRQADYIVNALPLTSATKHLLSTAEFSVMKPTAIVMNVGRGPVIDEAALVVALKEKKIAGACLDVFEVEPLPKVSFFGGRWRFSATVPLKTMLITCITRLLAQRRFMMLEGVFFEIRFS